MKGNSFFAIGLLGLTLLFGISLSLAYTPLRPVRLGWPNRQQAAAAIALWIAESCKPPRHDKGKKPLGETSNNLFICKFMCETRM